MKPVNLIAAVGKQGQIGLNGRMPWHDPEDLAWFRKMTMGDHVIMGGVTHKTVAPLLDGRTCWGWGRDIDPLAMLNAISATSGSQEVIWIAGGARTYQAFMPWVRRSLITHIDYEGEADTYMPELWVESW